WGREDFSKGDYAHHDGTWYEIKRVNSKSVTVAAIVGSDHARLQLGGSQVYRLQDNPYPWTDTLTYTKITGRISAQDMADQMPRQPTPHLPPGGSGPSPPKLPTPHFSASTPTPRAKVAASPQQKGTNMPITARNGAIL